MGGKGSVYAAGMADKLVRKLVNMRIFEDADGRTNLGLKDVEGELLLISQFTLYADCKKGNRPSFTKAGAPAMAEPLVEYIIEECKKDMAAMNVKPATVHPQATQEICGMLESYQEDDQTYVRVVADELRVL